MGRLKEFVGKLKLRWFTFPRSQKLNLIAVIALLLVLPVSVGGVLTIKNIRSKASYPITPPLTPTPTSGYNFLITRNFDGLDILGRDWNWSGVVGSNAVVDNGRLKLSVPQGTDGIGGNDIVAQVLENGNVPIIVRDFEVTVDLLGVTTESGWQELKFAPGSSISVRRSKNGLAETLEVWTSLTNTPADSVRNVYRSLPNNPPLKVKMVKKGSEMLIYYWEGETGTFVNILDMEYAPEYVSYAIPRLVVENSGPNFPATVGYFDNLEVKANELTYLSTPTSTPTAIDLPDLQVTRLELKKVYPPQLPCVSYQIQVDVSNRGKSPASQSQLRVTLSPGQTQAINKCTSTSWYDQSLAPIPQGDSHFLNPGQTETYTNYFNPTNTGNVRINARIDPYNDVPESNELNNSLFNDYTVEKLYPPTTPRPTLTATPSPTSISSSTPTPRPITKPTPTATAIPNSKPVITTWSLPVGRINRNYSVTIVGYDLNIDNSLGMNTTGLPTNFGVKGCTTTIVQNRKVVKCTYTGIPKKAGIFRIRTTLNDYAGGVAIKNYYLLILPY